MPEAPVAGALRRSLRSSPEKGESNYDLSFTFHVGGGLDGGKGECGGTVGKEHCRAQKGGKEVCKPPLPPSVATGWDAHFQTEAIMW